MKNVPQHGMIVLLTIVTVEAMVAPDLKNIPPGLNAVTLKKINKLYFLIHGFCYAEMVAHKKPGAIDANFQRYWDREKKCAEKWRSRLREFSDNEVLVIIPWRGDQSGPAATYHSFAVSALGDRCFLLDCPDSFAPEFWREEDTAFNRAVVRELKAALLGQRDQWNDEELHTALHALACCRQLDSLLQHRGFCFDKNQVSARRKLGRQL